MNRVLEIRSYRLKPGSGAKFHHLVENKSVPLLREWGMEVVAFGQSLHDPDSYYLMRAFNDLNHLNSSQDAFYSTDAWRKGPREAVVELIEADSNAVLWLTQEAIEAVRNSNGCGLGPN